MVARVLIFILFWSVAQAQTLVSRADLMRLAERSASVEVARARVLSAEAQAGQSGFSGSASGSASLAGVTSTSGDTVFSYPWNLQLNLRFAGLWGEVSDTRVQAVLNLERAKRALVTARIRALVQAVNLWHGLRRGLANLEVTQLAFSLAILEDLASEARFKAGGISISERERFGLALELARLEVARAEARLSGVRLQFEVLFGLRGALVTDDWRGLPERVFSDSQLEAREDVFEARAAVVLAGLQQGAAQRLLLPIFNLEASARGSAGALSVSTNQFLALSVGYSYPVSLPVGVSTSFSIGLSLSIPIQPLAGFGAANTAVLVAQRSLEVAFALARAEVVSKRFNLALSRSALDLAVRSNDFLSRQFERVQTRVSAGLVSVLDLKKAELDVLKSKLQVLDAQADLDLSLLEFNSSLAIVLEAQ